jgi:phenylpropionate dioxygenase-like ring-hydroxylating dioxygenase large terminal subunit
MSTTLEKVTDQDVQTALLHGLRNRWHPILRSDAVMAWEKPLGVVRLGEPLAIWRDRDGDVHVQTDRCPHRAVPLSRAINEGDRIRCNYHGVEIGPDGTVLKVPGQPGCPLEGARAVKTYPVREAAGAIFVWFGDAMHQDADELVLPRELAGGEWSQFLCYAEWNAPWRYILDNVMDPMHGTFLHAVSHSMSDGKAEATFVIRATDTGYVFEKEDQRDVNFDWVELVDQHALYMRLEVPYPKSGGPGGNFGIIAFTTPIDAENSAAFFWRTRKLSGWQRDAWRFLYRTRLEPRHWHVLEQDRTMMEGLKPGLEQFETLYAHDVGVVRMRRHLAQAARAQLSALGSAPG